MCLDRLPAASSCERRDGQAEPDRLLLLYKTLATALRLGAVFAIDLRPDVDCAFVDSPSAGRCGDDVQPIIARLVKRDVRFTVVVTDSTKHAMRDSRKLTLTVNRAPVVTGIRPAHGPRKGLTTVTVTGSGFVPGPGKTIFSFGELQALAVHCRSHTRCVMQAPPHAAGPVDVAATVHELVSARTAGDRYKYAR